MLSLARRSSCGGLLERVARTALRGRTREDRSHGGGRLGIREYFVAVRGVGSGLQAGEAELVDGNVAGDAVDADKLPMPRPEALAISHVTGHSPDDLI
jgi:hypothetical protein